MTYGYVIAQEPTEHGGRWALRGEEGPITALRSGPPTHTLPPRSPLRQPLFVSITARKLAHVLICLCFC